jgi:hypothetical protein
VGGDDKVWKNPLVWIVGPFGWLILFGVIAASLDRTAPRLAVAFGYIAGVGLLSAFVVCLVVLGQLATARTRQLVSAVSRADPKVIRERSGDVFNVVVRTAVLLAVLAGLWWGYDKYLSQVTLLDIPYIGEHVCSSRLEQTLSTIAPERDPKVEKCVRREASGSRADSVKLLFTCITRVLDPDGEYRSVACTVSCSVEARKLRGSDFSVDDICPRVRR